MSLETGQIVDGKYRVVRLIGEGGMGTVYEGLNTRIGRRVAIKVLHAAVAAQPEFVARFEREARAAARIGSPHVCHVYDLGDLPNGDRYLVMEYLDGVSFEQRITSRGRLTPAQLAPIAFELLDGLATMHEARVIHRDLKPANVFLARAPTPRGEVVKILDFGVAKMLPIDGELSTKTTVGLMIGTPLYMSPEQARGAQDIDGRTDLYAASVMFYQALTGEMPYTASTLNELLFKIALESPKPIRERQPDVDDALAEIIHTGLSRDPGRRFSSARAYQEAIALWGKRQGRPSLSFQLPMERSEPTDPPPPMPSFPDLGHDSDAAVRRSAPKVPADVPPALAGSAPTAWSGARPLSRPSLAAEAASLPPVTDEVGARASKTKPPSRDSTTRSAWRLAPLRHVLLFGASGAVLVGALVTIALQEQTSSSNQAAASASVAEVNDARPASVIERGPAEPQPSLQGTPLEAAADAAVPATPVAAPPRSPTTTTTTTTAQTPAPPVLADRAAPAKKASGPPPAPQTSASSASSAGGASAASPPPPTPPVPPVSSVRSFRRSLD